MELEITASQTIDFAPDEIAEIAQNVRTILTTPVFSVPLDREFGVDLSLLDSPMPVTKARLTAKIVAAIQKYEPRAQVLEVTYTGDAFEGRLIPSVKVRINGVI
ncbi:hypothetical protein SCACP_21280 [Sporomusa carbonis]|uniref:GPW/gp25 family protein n=1 Tax=Sporomusa carbonis TaxID=3076075 RepID=UPI003A676B41